MKRHLGPQTTRTEFKGNWKEAITCLHPWFRALQKEIKVKRAHALLITWIVKETPKKRQKEMKEEQDFPFIHLGRFWSFCSEVYERHIKVAFWERCLFLGILFCLAIFLELFRKILLLLRLSLSRPVNINFDKKSIGKKYNTSPKLSVNTLTNVHKLRKLISGEFCPSHLGYFWAFALLYTLT